MTGVQRREFLLTEPLLSQVNVDDEEHEATSSLFLPTDKRVHPACGINTKRWNCLVEFLILKRKMQDVNWQIFHKKKTMQLKCVLSRTFH